MGITTDPNDPDLTRGVDTSPVPQAKKYLALPDEELKKGYVVPLRSSYTHNVCGRSTTMPVKTAETYARDPWFYGGTYCVHCAMHRPMSEFIWQQDGMSMDPSKWNSDYLAAVEAAKAGERIVAPAIPPPAYRYDLKCDQCDTLGPRVSRETRRGVEMLCKKCSDALDTQRAEERRAEDITNDSIENAYWRFDQLKKNDRGMSERDAFKQSVREMLRTLRAPR